jgi:hypothetical protein
MHLEHEIYHLPGARAGISQLANPAQTAIRQLHMAVDHTNPAKPAGTSCTFHQLLKASRMWQLKQHRGVVHQQLEHGLHVTRITKSSSVLITSALRDATAAAAFLARFLTFFFWFLVRICPAAAPLAAAGASTAAVLGRDVCSTISQRRSCNVSSNITFSGLKSV